MTVTVTLDLPPDAEAENPDELVRRLRLLWVLDEVRQGRMTRLRGAKQLGLSLDEFLRQALNHGLDAIEALRDRRSGHYRFALAHAGALYWVTSDGTAIRRLSTHQDARQSTN
jgi:hypothetical protein